MLLDWRETDELLNDIARVKPKLYQVCQCLGLSKAAIVEEYRAYYKHHGLSTRAAAKLLGVKHPYLINVEKGKYPPSPKLLGAMLLAITTNP